MAKFTVNVHYDYVATVEVEAENEEQALELAKDVADGLSTEDLLYVDFTGAYVVEQ
jgi:hypothetical protein